MRVLYATTYYENGKKEVKVHKVVSTAAIRFYPETKEIGLGNRFYQLQCSDGAFEELTVSVLKQGILDLRSVSYREVHKKKDLDGDEIGDE